VPLKVLYVTSRLVRIRQSLEEAGYRLITAAASGVVAVTARGECPDIALVDLDEMEDSGVLSTLEPSVALRIPLVFVTRCLTSHRQDLSRRLGAMALLPDGVDPVALAATLRLWVDRDREMKVLRASELRLLDALSTSRSVSHAVGVMAERHSLPLTNAFELLRSQARNARKRIDEFAKEVRPRASGR
jgi:AmiR/NasT family two-component response regulator